MLDEEGGNTFTLFKFDLFGWTVHVNSSTSTSTCAHQTWISYSCAQELLGLLPSSWTWRPPAPAASRLPRLHGKDPTHELS